MSQKKLKVKLRDLLLLPNLLSLLRVALTPAIGYFLWLRTEGGILVCVGLLAVAGLTDLLDGFLARRMGRVTALGTLLDPLADKIFAVVLVIELTIFRSLPIWLAVAILSRDLIILVGATFLLKGRELEIPSNLTGKYYFASLSLLILSHIISYPFGERLFLYLVVILLIASLFNYTRRFLIVYKGGVVPVFADRTLYKNIRSILTIIIVVIGFYYFYVQVIVRYLK